MKRPPPASAPEKRTDVAALASGALLRNALINLSGQVVPLVVAVAAIPLLIGGLGTERFGILALVWVAIGYFGFLDLGLSRALTQMVAARVADDREGEVRGLVRTGIAVMTALAVAGSVLLLITAEPFARVLLRVPDELHGETVWAIRLLALSLPAVIASAGYRGALEAFHRFGLVNAIKIPGSAIGFLGPVAVLPFTDHLVPVVGVLIASRVAVLIAYGLGYHKHAPKGPTHLLPALVPRLFAFGGWMTVSNVISPLMVYVDRFLIGAFLSISAVAYYVTPHEVVTKLLVLPGAVAAVFFPAFSGMPSGGGDHRRLVALGIKTVYAALFPAVLLAVVFAEEGLALWVGQEFADQGAGVLRLLAIGVLINAVGQILFAFVQGRGRPDLTAKLHLIELPIYVALIVLFLPRWGIEGAALAWTCRVALDTVLLWLVADRISSARSTTFGVIGGVGVSAAAILAVGSLVVGLAAKVLVSILSMALFAILFWKVALDVPDREYLGRLKHRMLTSNRR